MFRAGDLTIDYGRRRVLRKETEIRLTPREFELLSLLARNHDRVLTHRTVLKAIRGPNAVEQPEHLWTLVAQLRKKLEPDPANPQYLSASRGLATGSRSANQQFGSTVPAPRLICRPLRLNLRGFHGRFGTLGRVNATYEPPEGSAGPGRPGDLPPPAAMTTN